MGFRKSKGFTLLELIIAIIIIGVLASLAIPRFLKVIEYSRSTEAFVNISAIRQAIERCYLMKGGGEYMPDCHLNAAAVPSQLDIDDPSNFPGAHFSYIANSMSGVKYMITAYRTGYEAPIKVVDRCWYVRLQLNDDDTITRSGVLACAGIK